MSERSARYETAVATFVGVMALLVSAYTAYMQRQQVRAQVWPILEFVSSNDPTLTLSVSNKGVGPAIIRHVFITVDGDPMPYWRDVLQRLLGPGKHNLFQSSISNRILAAGETMEVMTPRDEKNHALTIGAEGSPGYLFNEGRRRIGAEVCYCSALGDCWTLIDVPDKPAATVETRRCPAPSQRSFKQ